MVNVILDEAANKGTGKWTSQSALNIGEPLSLITESVFARYISSLKDDALPHLNFSLVQSAASWRQG
ncbi:hypothetical protein ACNKHW_12870 [Shigella flexneri]